VNCRFTLFADFEFLDKSSRVVSFLLSFFFFFPLLLFVCRDRLFLFPGYYFLDDPLRLFYDVFAVASLMIWFPSELTLPFRPSRLP
jgi:hypothetical protein